MPVQWALYCPQGSRHQTQRDWPNSVAFNRLLGNEVGDPTDSGPPLAAGTALWSEEWHLASPFWEGRMFHDRFKVPELTLSERLPLFPSPV